MWGFWASLGWTALIGLGYIGAQLLVLLGYAVTKGVSGGGLGDLAGLETNGFFVAAATTLSMPVAVGLALLFARVRQGLPLRDYFALRRPRARATVWWTLAVCAFVFLSESVLTWLGQPLVPEVMVDVYRSAGFKPLLWFALVVAAPVTEEVVMRGFLFVGIQQSQLGAPGAILITAALWAVMHVQYDALGISTIFLAGILLGLARLRSGSIWLCMLLHAVINLIATLEIAFLLVPRP